MVYNIYSIVKLIKVKSIYVDSNHTSAVIVKGIRWSGAYLWSLSTFTTHFGVRQLKWFRFPWAIRLGSLDGGSSRYYRKGHC